MRQEIIDAVRASRCPDYYAPDGCDGPDGCAECCEAIALAVLTAAVGALPKRTPMPPEWCEMPCDRRSWRAGYEAAMARFAALTGAPVASPRPATGSAP